MKSIANARRNMRNRIEHRMHARGYRSLNAYMRFNRVWWNQLDRMSKRRGFGSRMLALKNADGKIVGVRGMVAPINKPEWPKEAW